MVLGGGGGERPHAELGWSWHAMRAGDFPSIGMKHVLYLVDI